jgi:serine/threonine protein kinase/tetratricopeptide (TPR) repeat protein
MSPGVSVAYYRILSRLGAGGMGEVYLVQDTRLGRKVALKILSPDLTHRADRLLRFEQEARAASALNHPNILTIHDIGQEGDTRYIATEYVEGETLRARLARGPLPLRDALDFAVQIAGALAAAHAAGIVHRDIKPENLMLRPDGLVKVLDFGLAKLNESERTPSSDEGTATVAAFDTEPGHVAGTPFYMSPEQARGLKVDARTDIFSLGTVLYEMLAGRRPFEGETTSHAMVAILEKEPMPLTRYLPDAPPELQRILSKALAKNRDERYQVVKDLQIDLKSLAGQTSTHSASPEPLTVPRGPRRISKRALSAGGVVVLAAAGFWFWLHRAPALTTKDTILVADFVNTTGDPVFDGTLKQGLAAQLEQSPYLSLTPDQRVRDTLRLMSRPPDTRVTPEIARDICQRLGFKAFIEGSVAPLGAHYVLTLAAVNAATGEDLARIQLEADSKERILHTLSDAAAQLRRKLGESLASIEKTDVPLEQATTSSLEALKAYSLGVQATLAGKFPEAITYYQRAVELDPNFARAWRGISATSSNLAGRREAVIETGRKAYELRDRASELERLLIDEWYYQVVAPDQPRALGVLETATRLYPNSVVAWHQLAIVARQLNQYDKALAASQAELRILPSAIGYGTLSGTFLALNRYAEARQVCVDAEQRQMDNRICHRTLYRVAIVTGDAAAAKVELDRWAGLSDPTENLTAQRDTAEFRGQVRMAREMQQRLFDLSQTLAAGLTGRGSLEAFWGLCREALEDSSKGLQVSRSLNALSSASLSAASCGDPRAFDAAIGEIQRNDPKAMEDTSSYYYYVRALGQSLLGRPVDLAPFRVPTNWGQLTGMSMDYYRGEIFRGQKQPAEAVAAFQHVLDHRGRDPLSPYWVAAHLGLGRAAAQSGDTAKARQSYQDFFALMKDADQDLPLLAAARREYEQLR